MLSSILTNGGFALKTEIETFRLVGQPYYSRYSFIQSDCERNNYSFCLSKVATFMDWSKIEKAFEALTLKVKYHNSGMANN